MTKVLELAAVIQNEGSGKKAKQKIWKIKKQSCKWKPLRKGLKQMEWLILFVYNVEIKQILKLYYQFIWIIFLMEILVK